MHGIMEAAYRSVERMDSRRPEGQSRGVRAAPRSLPQADSKASFRGDSATYLRQRIEVGRHLAGNIPQGTSNPSEPFVRSGRETRSFTGFAWYCRELALCYWARQHQRTALSAVGRSCARDELTYHLLSRCDERRRFERLQDALSRLSPDHREVILLARRREVSRRTRSPSD